MRNLQIYQDDAEDVSEGGKNERSKNKGRSMEGTLVKITKILAVLFFILAAVLNTRFF